jgi:hypothetical protein
VLDLNPPPNPAKVNDPRAKIYIAKFGKDSWELDALEPEVLNNLIATNITPLIDKDGWKYAKDKQQRHIELLKEMAQSLGE